MGPPPTRNYPNSLSMKPANVCWKLYALLGMEWTTLIALLRHQDAPLKHPDSLPKHPIALLRLLMGKMAIMTLIVLTLILTMTLFVLTLILTMTGEKSQNDLLKLALQVASSASSTANFFFKVASA